MCKWIHLDVQILRKSWIRAVTGQAITNVYLALPVFDTAFYVPSFVRKLLKNLITDSYNSSEAGRYWDSSV